MFELQDTIFGIVWCVLLVAAAIGMCIESKWVVDDTDSKNNDDETC